METILTREGFEKLSRELVELSHNRRQEIAKMFSEFMNELDDEDGMEIDLVRSEQAFVEGRIQTLRTILAQAKILDKTEKSNIVEIGSLVTVKENGELCKYLIVDPIEANPMEQKISFRSPIGKAIINKTIGDALEIQTPDGKIHLEIIDIQ